MPPTQPPPRPNKLVEASKAAGAAVRAGDQAALKAVSQNLARTGGSFQPASAEVFGTLPSPVPEHAKSTSQADGVPHRAVYLDKPPPSNDQSHKPPSNDHGHDH